VTVVVAVAREATETVPLGDRARMAAITPGGKALSVVSRDEK
jgi:hypothetical protein